jgi:hypothetical protein
MCKRLENRALSSWLDRFQDKTLSVQREERLWHVEPNGRKWSGQPDVVYRLWTGLEYHFLILDDKTSYGEHDDPDYNLQLRGYALVLAHNHEDVNIGSITVGLVQPRVSWDVDLVTYREADLHEAAVEIKDMLDYGDRPDAPRIPGPSQCNHCRAIGVCPEAKAAVTALIAEGATLDLDGHDLANWLEGCAVAEKVIDFYRTQAKRMLADDPNAIPGWTLKDGATRREITDPQGAFDASGLPVEEFMPIVDVPVGKLETLTVDHWQALAREEGTELTKTYLKQEFNKTMLPYITTTKNAPSLVRVKEKP